MANARAELCRAGASAACIFMLATSLAPAAQAQSVISAHSGVIHYTEGDVTLAGSPVRPKFSEFPDIKPGQLIATEEGRAEILLTPGVFLRLAENSSVRMLSNALTDTRLEIVSGSVLVEVAELLEHNAISLEAAGARIALAKKGLYRMEAGRADSVRLDADREPLNATASLDAKPASLRVYEGQAWIAKGGESLIAKKGHRIELGASKLADARFDIKDTDSFYRWSGRRAEYVAAANVISARVTSNSSYRSGFASSASGWSWNPYFGMFTFLPANGIYWSPFGSAFYSPAAITTMYFPVRSFSGGLPRYGALGGPGTSPVSSGPGAALAGQPMGGHPMSGARMGGPMGGQMGGQSMGGMGRAGASLPAGGAARGGGARGH